MADHDEQGPTLPPSDTNSPGQDVDESQELQPPPSDINSAGQEVEDSQVSPPPPSDTSIATDQQREPEEVFQDMAEFVKTVAFTPAQPENPRRVASRHWPSMLNVVPMEGEDEAEPAADPEPMDQQVVDPAPEPMDQQVVDPAPEPNEPQPGNSRGGPSHGFDIINWKNPINTKRLEMEKIIREFMKKGNEHLIPTPEQVKLLTPALKSWVYNRLAQVKKYGKRHQTELKEMNAARRDIIERLPAPVPVIPPRQQNPLQGEIQGNKALAKPETQKRLKKGYYKVVEEISKPATPPKYANVTYYPKSSGCWDHIVSPPKITKEKEKKEASTQTPTCPRPDNRADGPRTPSPEEPMATDNISSPCGHSGSRQKTPSPQTLPKSGGHSSKEVEEEKIADIGQPFIHLTAKISSTCEKDINCNRAGAYAAFLPQDDKFIGVDGIWCYKVERPIIQPTEVLFSESRIPQTQVNCIKHYNKNAPSDAKIKEVQDKNKEVFKLIFGIGLESIFATANMMENSGGRPKLWHGDFMKKFLDNLKISFEVGHKAPIYNLPSDEWMMNERADEIRDTTSNNLMYIDEHHWPMDFPLVNSFTLLRSKVRTAMVGSVMGIDMYNYDFEGFLPYPNYEMSYSSLQAVTKILCDHTQTDITRKTKYFYFKPDWNLLGMANESLDKLKLRNYDFLTEKIKSNDGGRLAEDLKKGNIGVVIIRFLPWRRKIPMEVMVTVDCKKGEYKVFSSYQPTLEIGDWSPYNPTTTYRTAKECLVKQLELLRLYLKLVLPRSNTISQEWTRANYFQKEEQIDKLMDDDEKNNRVILCKYLEWVIGKDQEPRSYFPWKIGRSRPAWFEVPGANQGTATTVVQKLSEANGNFHVNGRDNEGALMPNEFVDELFQPNGFYSVALPWLRLRYHDMVRNYLNL